MKKYGFMVVAVLVLTALCVFGGEKKKTEDYITVQPYNKHAQWKYEECTYCNGTGIVITKKYDHKRNRTIVIVKACPYCKGTGKRGMSKK